MPSKSILGFVHNIFAFFKLTLSIILNKHCQMLKFRFIILLILLNSGLGFSQSIINSKLASGKWIKVGVTQSGIYSLDKSFFDANGISVSGVSIKRISVHGFGGVPLPEKNGVSYKDDLPELPIHIKDANNNGLLDGNDAILFYAVGPNPISYESGNNFFMQTLNPYSDSSYYFVRINSNTDTYSPTVKPFLSGTPTINVNKYTEIALIEKDSLNITHSGRNWYWKSFEYTSNYSVSHQFQGSGYVDSAKIKIDLITRCVNCSSNQPVTLNGNNLGAISIHPSGDQYNGDMGLLQSGFFKIPVTTNFNFSFNKPSNVANVWLDRVVINVNRVLGLYGSQTSFRSSATLQNTVVGFQAFNAVDKVIWDVTDPVNILKQDHLNGYFVIQGGQLNEFVVFDPDASFNNPYFVKNVDNQNIHGMPYADMIIVAPHEFYEAALRLAKHRFQNDNITSSIVSPEAIYNEFSSGSQDPTAIRNMMKMFKDRTASGDPMVKYLLLFGDGSYDYKEYLNRVPDNTSNPSANKNRNWVLTWQTKNSVSRAGGSYPSDDYFVMLDANNIVGVGEYEALSVTSPLSAGVGRILAYDKASADNMVNKIIHYDNAFECRGDWRNKIVLLADDMDESWENQFIYGSEGISNIINQNFPEYNVNKIYADAYTQVISNGQRYPEVTKQVFTQLDKGVLLFNYIGHGGEIGLGGERYLSIDDVNNWQNMNNLPVFLTATCTFTRFDLAKEESAGELMARRPDGGAIALFSTTRAISIVNQFNSAFYNAAFSPKPDGTMPTMGDVFMYAKNNSSDGTSAPISLFGDPSQKMAYPRNKVYTSAIYDENDELLDTLKATQVVRIEGYIADSDGFFMNDFNGIVYPTIYDKPSNYVTKQNDANSTALTFTIQKNILFRGSAKVTNGKFEFIFKVPKDINYTVDYGKISYYAASQTTDAHGYDSVLVGGSLNTCVETDGPSVQILLNNSPINGQTVSANPELKVVFEDESGINSSGLGIGHDIILTLEGADKNVQIFNLNEYYSSYQGTYTKGELTYPLLNLAQGTYKLHIGAWDNCNSYGENDITFVVDTSAGIISEFLAFPNPSDDIINFAFHHNLPEEETRVLLQIYDIRGMLVHTISQKLLTSNYKNMQLTWDGRMPGGNPVAPGVYVAKITLVSASGKVATKTSKLIRSK